MKSYEADKDEEAEVTPLLFTLRGAKQDEKRSHFRLLVLTNRTRFWLCFVMMIRSISVAQKATLQ